MCHTLFDVVLHTIQRPHKCHLLFHVAYNSRGPMGQHTLGCGILCRGLIGGMYSVVCRGIRGRGLIHVTYDFICLAYNSRGLAGGTAYSLVCHIVQRPYSCNIIFDIQLKGLMCVCMYVCVYVMRQHTHPKTHT